VKGFGVMVGLKELRWEDNKSFVKKLKKEDTPSYGEDVGGRRGF